MKTVYEDMTEDAEIIVRAIQAGTIGRINMMSHDRIIAKRDALPAHIATMDAKKWNAYMEADEEEES